MLVLILSIIIVEIILGVLFIFNKKGTYERVKASNKYLMSSWFWLSLISYVVSLVFLSISLSTIWKENPTEVVGGDAYNYIIAGTHSIVYMLIALFMLFVGTIFLHFFNKKK